MTQDKGGANDPKHVQAGINAARAVFDYSTKRDVWVKAVFDFATKDFAYIYLEEPSGIVYGLNRVRIEHIKETDAPAPEASAAPGDAGGEALPVRMELPSGWYLRTHEPDILTEQSVDVYDANDCLLLRGAMADPKQFVLDMFAHLATEAPAAPSEVGESDAAFVKNWQHAIKRQSVPMASGNALTRLIALAAIATQAAPQPPQSESKEAASARQGLLRSGKLDLLQERIEGILQRKRQDYYDLQWVFHFARQALFYTPQSTDVRVTELAQDIIDLWDMHQIADNTGHAYEVMRKLRDALAATPSHSADARVAELAAARAVVKSARGVNVGAPIDHLTKALGVYDAVLVKDPQS